MSDVLMIAATFAALALLQLYVRWCDAIATRELIRERGSATVNAATTDEAAA